MVINQTFEDFIEQAYWEFDALVKNKEYRHYSERDKFKMAARAALNKVNNETGIQIFSQLVSTVQNSN